jgi:hypothetical protein
LEAVEFSKFGSLAVGTFQSGRGIIIVSAPFDLPILTTIFTFKFRELIGPATVGRLVVATTIGDILRDRPDKLIPDFQRLWKGEDGEAKGGSYKLAQFHSGVYP